MPRGAIPEKVIKTPEGAPVPKGWELVRVFRGRQYIREIPAPAKPPVTAQQIDDLINAFGTMGVKAEVAPADEIETLMSGLSMGKGRRGKKTRGRKSRRMTRRR